MLDKYVAEVKNHFGVLDNVPEEKIVAYLYLELGNLLSFDINFLPFGSSKKRQEIYSKSSFLRTLENCFKEKTVICKSISYILAYVGKKLGIDIIVVKDKNDTRRTPHCYNVIRPKDGGEPYTVDLQEDMYHIKMHDSIENFGLSLKKHNTYVIALQRQKELFESLGYYTYEDYYDNMKLDLGCIEKFRDKVGFVLENIEICENPYINHIDRQWCHARRLEKLFDRIQFNYREGSGKIRFKNCYKIIDGKKTYYNVVVVDNGDNPDIYIYSAEEFRYIKIDIMDFASEVIDGLTIHDAKIRGLKKAISRLKRQRN